MDKVNFQNYFNTWWASVKDCGKYTDAPKTTKYIHYNPNALFSYDDQRKVITQRILGLKRSLNTIKRIYNLRQENPNLNKTQINKLYELKYKKKGATSIRKYWETIPYEMEQEVMKINLEYMIEP